MRYKRGMTTNAEHAVEHTVETPATLGAAPLGVSPLRVSGPGFMYLSLDSDASPPLAESDLYPLRARADGDSFSGISARWDDFEQLMSALMRVGDSVVAVFNQ